jgi:signal transduction histidine kinase/CheY-like chemotaxis protein
MSLDTLQWLAERAGWAWLIETQGDVRMNDRARALLGDESGSFDELAARLADLSPAAVSAAVDRTELAGCDGRRARWVITEEGRILMVEPLPPRRSGERSPEDDLARAVGHELGNALGAVVGWIGMLRQNPETLTDESLARLERAASTARRAARTLVGGIDESDSDIGELLHDVARLLEPTAQAHGTSITVDAPEGMETGHPRGELFRIVWNLALNAVQLTEKGTVRLDASSSGGRLVLGIEDDGPGMTKDVRSRIFEAGYGRRDGGSGIGLSLVARTVRELGGNVRVRSDVGSGTRFEVRIPSAPRHSGVLPRARTPSRVLVVEDDEGIRELIQTTLNLRGIDAVVVETVAEAEAASGGSFDLAVADLTLPDGRGDRLLADLKSSGRAERTLLMSGHVDPGELAGPPDAWLGKPFDVPELVAAIEGRTVSRDAQAS